MIPLLLLSLHACTDPETEDDGEGGGDDGPSCLGVGFEGTATDWGLPDGFSGGVFEALGLSDSDLSWSLLDLDGDGLPDIVVTTNEALSAVGTSKWQVFLNTGDGFSDTATDWGLPDGFPQRTFEATADTDGGDGYGWALTDLDGDDRPDIVLTESEGAGGVGSSKWVVYQNTGAKFESAATDWGLPDGFPTGTFDHVYDADSSDDYGWSLLDLDGDGLADLVLTRSDAAGGVGSTKWLVYGNDGAGFADGATDWALPQGFASGTFEAAYDTEYGDDLAWSLVDLDGDDLPDIVLTSSEGAGVGTSKWELYPNTGSAFDSENVGFPLPEGFPNGAFEYLDDADGDDDDFTWSLTDLDGDDDPDIVLNWAASGGGVGTTTWRLYANIGTRMEPEASEWALPDGFESRTFDQIVDADGGDAYSWALVTLDGDTVPDLVFTRADAVGSVGTNKWLVYRGDCR